MQPAQTIAPQTSTSQGSSVGSATEQVPQCASSSASPGSSDASCHAAPRPQPRHSRRRAAPSGPRPRRLRARRRRSRGRPIPRDSDGRGERSPAPGTPDGRDERAPEAGRARGHAAASVSGGTLGHTGRPRPPHRPHLGRLRGEFGGWQPLARCPTGRNRSNSRSRHDSRECVRRPGRPGPPAAAPAPASPRTDPRRV